MSKLEEASKTGTKQKIVHAALDLFARKGYTETGIREIAKVVGIKEATLYHHFKSKNAIIEYNLEHYAVATGDFTASEERFAHLTKESSVDDILACFTLYFSSDNAVQLLQTLDIIFQEQCRNNAVKEFVIENKINWLELHVTEILKRLIRCGALSEETDIDFWARQHANIGYMFTGRYSLGIGEMYPQFEGYGMEEILRMLYETVFKLYGTKH